MEDCCWVEIETAERDKRRELVLQGSKVDSRIRDGGGYLPPQLFRLSLLNYLEVSQCRSLQELQPSIGSLTQLQSLILCHNQLTALPAAALGQLRNLRVLDVSNNHLQCLPTELRNLNELNTINASCNRLQILPAELCMCQKLAVLNVSHNELSRFPDEFFISGRLSALSTLSASENAIEELPGDICNLPSLKVMNAKGVRRFYLASEKVLHTLDLEKQNKLHDEICEKRTVATIATHELKKVKGPLLYDARPPQTLKIAPLGRNEVKAANLLQQLKQEAEELRKQKKRPNVSGLHKYLQLLDGKENYPCVVDADGDVISFPPITNSDKTKVSKTTTDLFMEVTSSVSLQVCKDVMDTLILKMAELNKFTFTNKETEASSDPETDPADLKSALGEVTVGGSEQSGSPELTVEQVRVVDIDGNLKVVYPAKTDLNMELSSLTVVR
ncbi:leucine-rich repeat-containing protein 47 [Protopterus annectens]|uniref:leucine-rich repeat-containing protein 47 n=1 Tax=Protopterus annectens TaxID=7888 RepID=UPI001CF9AB15|nr:leucine-rich repeat-containing protein 47 [Protopterus annectens]